MHTSNSIKELPTEIKNASKNPLLAELGLPDCNKDDIALTWLHLAATYLKFSIIADLGEFYCERISQAHKEIGFGKHICAFGSAAVARDHAQNAYLKALSVDPNLAEAHFGLARSIQLQNQRLENKDTIISHFQRCLDLQPHIRGLPHAYLHANTHWEIACIYDDAGRDEEALTAYRNALSLLSNFGVQHIRVARFFRKHGLYEDASSQYLICSRYSHRYFPEFILPPLVSDKAEDSRALTNLDTVFTTPEGDSIYFNNGKYILVPTDEKSTQNPVFPIDKSFNTTLLGNSFLYKLKSLFIKPKPQNNFKSAETIVELVNK